MALDRAKSEAERAKIEAALAKHDRNIEETARELGAARRTLQNRMRAYGIAPGKSGRPRVPMPYTRAVRAKRWARRNQGSLALGAVAAVGAAVFGYKHLRRLPPPSGK
jgi:transposase-like protein